MWYMSHLHNSKYEAHIYIYSQSDLLDYLVVHLCNYMHNTNAWENGYIVFSLTCIVSHRPARLVLWGEMKGWGREGEGEI